jgi:PAS domain S-box-containing protein
VPDPDWFTDLRPLFDELNCGVIASDEANVIRMANDRLLSWLGYDRAELVNIRVDELVPLELRELLNEEIELVDAGDMRARLTTLRRKDSTTFPVVVLPHRLRDPDGQLLARLSILVELGTIQTARQVSHPSGNEVRSALEQIALELHSISLMAGPSPAAPLEHPDLSTLSPREREVLGYLIAGDRVPAIARHLSISPHTVRNHLKATYRKLGVETQAQLIDHIRALAS